MDAPQRDATLLEIDHEQQAASRCDFRPFEHGMRNILAIVLAGGEGARLQPLTADRCKPAMPFHGKHFLVDFVLSNLVNSEVLAIYVLVQYRSQPLIEHIANAWALAPQAAGRFISVVPPQLPQGAGRFLGTADAVFQNIRLIEELQPALVAVFSADHVYRMDVRQMVDFHRASRAHATIATVPVPLQQSRHFGIVQSDTQGRITAFSEKPGTTGPCLGSTTHAHASMGNYIFDAEVLLQQLRRMQAEGGTDFARHVLPSMVATHRLCAYDFTTNKVPGTQAFEEPGYWRDVGTLDAYFAAQFDAVGATPAFSMMNSQWPIYAAADPVGAAQVEDALVRRSVLGPGCMVSADLLDGAVLRPAVRVEAQARLQDCIVMDGARIGQGAHVRRAIIDQHNDIPPGERIGMDLGHDRSRFTVTPGGIVVVPAGYFPACSRVHAGVRRVAGDDAGPLPAGQLALV